MTEITDKMKEAARPFLLGMKCGAYFYDSMRAHFERGGTKIPEWMQKREGHITKDAQAECIYRLMNEVKEDE